MTNQLTKLVIWDSDPPPSAARPDMSPRGTTHLLWNSYAASSEFNLKSLPAYVEQNARYLRAVYLEWVYSLGETTHLGKRVIDILEFREGCSLWWMSPLVEKCNYEKSPWVNDAIKLLALEKFLREAHFKEVEINSVRDGLVDCVKSLCKSKNMIIRYRTYSNSRKSHNYELTKLLYKRLPSPVRAITWLARHVLIRWELRGLDVSKWKSTKGKILFVSYLLYLDQDLIKSGQFSSAYWGNLPDKLQESNIETNWLHIYVPNRQVPNAHAAKKLIDKFNSSGDNGQTHITLHSFMSLGVLYKTLVAWINSARVAKSIEGVISQVQIKGFSLWPLFKREWREFMTGATAISNQLYISLFQEAMDLLPRQESAIYLQENMDWEFAFLFAWRGKSHGRVIGYPHATIRFWDLRYYQDSRIYRRSNFNSMPRPDQVALNGDPAFEEFRSANYPMNEVVRVEALRYLHLSKFENLVPMRSPSEVMRLLVLLDYSSRRSHSLIGFLNMTLPNLRLNKPLDIIVKPHISTPVCLENYSKIDFTVSSEPLSKLLPICDLALTSATTSSAVEAYCVGLDVMVFLDQDAVNLSALRGVDGVRFITHSDDLADAIESCSGRTDLTRGVRPFFYLDPELPGWMALLRNNASGY